MVQSLTTVLVNQNIDLQMEISTQICDSALLLQSQQQLNRQITQQNKDMNSITDEILDVIQSLRTAANVPQNADLNQTFDSVINSLHKSLDALNSKLILSQTNAQTEVRHLLGQNNCANSTTVSPPTSSQSTRQSTPQSTPSPLKFCQSSKICANATQNNYLPDPNDCNAYYYCGLSGHEWARFHCPPGNRFVSSSTCVSDPSCSPKTTFPHNCTYPTFQSFAVPGDCTSYELCDSNGYYVQVCCTDGYLYNQNKANGPYYACDIPANASPKCTAY